MSTSSASRMIKFRNESNKKKKMREPHKHKQRKCLKGWVALFFLSVAIPLKNIYYSLLKSVWYGKIDIWNSFIIQSYTTIKLNWKAIEISLLFFIYEEKKIRIRAPKCIWKGTLPAGCHTVSGCVIGLMIFFKYLFSTIVQSDGTYEAIRIW